MHSLRCFVLPCILVAFCWAVPAAEGPKKTPTLQEIFEGTWVGETVITQGKALSMNKKAAGELKYPCTLVFDKAGQLVTGNVVGFDHTKGGITSFAPLVIKVSFENGGKTYTQTLQGQLSNDGTQITGTLSYRLGGGTFTLKKKVAADAVKTVKDPKRVTDGKNEK